MLGPAPHLVIFDCDGVLVDSEGIANACLADALAVEGLPLAVSEVRRRYVGLSLLTVVERVEAELERALPEGWLDALQATTFARLRSELRPVPGVRETVMAIQAAGLKTCVASSGSIAKMTLTLGTTGLLPLLNPRLFSSRSVARGKPFPDLFQWAARTFGIVPQHCIVVEDSLPGVEAAVAARMRVFGFTGDPLTDGAALKAAGASLFSDMRKLPGLLGIT